MSLQAQCIAVCLILAALGLGCWLTEREVAGKWPFRARRDHRQPFRYWRP